MSITTTSPLDKPELFEFIKEQVESGATNASIVKDLKNLWDLSTTTDSIRRFRKRHELQVPGQSSAYTKIDGNSLEAQCEPLTTRPVLDDPDTMLKDRGLDPEEWVITHVTPNEYQGPTSKEVYKATGQAVVTYYQTKFSAVRRNPIGIFEFPRTDGPRYFSDAAAPFDLDQLIVVVGDQQAPFHDKHLHRLFCQWLEVNCPDQGVSLGDSVDFPNPSRHPDDPDNTASPNECLQSGYDIYADYRIASLSTRWRKLIGNHDERLRIAILKDIKALHGLKRPDTVDSIGEEVLSLSHLMRLDELGIEVINPHGKYDLGQIQISDKLAIRHGWLAKKGSGSSALASLEQLGYSVIVGHTHRQSIVHQTKHEIDGKIRTVTGVEAGCMCRVDQTPDPEDGRIWPNYTTAPDWNQGFCTVTVHNNGFFRVDLATYVNKTLLWRDQIYQ